MIGTSVAAAAGEAARRQRRRQPPGRAERRPRARRAGRRLRALHLPQPARRRLDRRASARAGSSAARSTRASCTASSARSPGVEFIKILRVYETDLATGKQDPKPAGSYLELGRRRGDRLRRPTSSRPSARSCSEPTVFGTSLQRPHDPQARVQHDEPARPPVDARDPEVVSARGYLRNSLPAIYQDDDFGLRFVGALETLLDPIVGTLDVLDRYFHPTLAPRDVLDLLAAWLGLTRRRVVARRAAARGARRARASSRAGAAPRPGLKLALEHRLPRLPAAGRGRRRRHLVDRRRMRRRRRPRRASSSTATRRSRRRRSSRSRA